MLKSINPALSTIIKEYDEVVQGFMPKRALKLTFEWMELHKDELFENWKKCQKGIKPNPIELLKYIKIWI